MDISQDALEQITLSHFFEELEEVNHIVFKPPTKLNILEYAKQHCFLPSEYANPPGLYNSDRKKWQEGVLLALSYNPRVVLLAASQMGKSVIQGITLQYFVHQKPSPILFLVPNDKLAEDFSINRFTPLIKSSGLSHLLKREEDGSNKVDFKKYPGGSLYFRSAGSANNLTALTIKVLLCDEISKWEPLKAGDPVALANQRANEYGDQATYFYTSTPRIKGECRITAMYEDSNQNVYELKCIHCNEFFAPIWEYVQWESIGDMPQPDTAKLYCPHCGGAHDDYQRNTSIYRGRWRALNPENKKTIGFFVNCLSNHIPLSTPVIKYLEALNDELKMIAFVNEQLALPYEYTGETFSNADFINRLEVYDRSSLPPEVLFITVGGDTQQNRVEVVVYGWGKDFESYAIERLVIHGSPDSDSTWAALHNELQQAYTRVDGSQVKVLKVCIDSGGNTADIGGFSEFVKKACKKYARYNWVAVKGASTPQKTIFPQLRKKSDVYLIDTVQAKNLLFGNLKKEKPGPGYVHFSNVLDDDFFNQLTGESRLITKKNGKTKIEYIPLSHSQRVEVLDCTVYAIAGRFSLSKNVETMILGNPKFKPAQYTPDPILRQLEVIPSRIHQDYTQPKADAPAEPVKKKLIYTARR